MTAEQKRTLRIRSHLSGIHPGAAGGDDCLSRNAQQLKAHGSFAESHDGNLETRKAVGGTVTHH